MRSDGIRLTVDWVPTLMIFKGGSYILKVLTTVHSLLPSIVGPSDGLFATR